MKFIKKIGLLAMIACTMHYISAEQDVSKDPNNDNYGWQSSEDENYLYKKPVEFKKTVGTDIIINPSTDVKITRDLFNRIVERKVTTTRQVGPNLITIVEIWQPKNYSSLFTARNAAVAAGVGAAAVGAGLYASGLLSSQPAQIIADNAENNVALENQESMIAPADNSVAAAPENSQSNEVSAPSAQENDVQAPVQAPVEEPQSWWDSIKAFTWDLAGGNEPEHGGGQGFDADDKESDEPRESAEPINRNRILIPYADGNHGYYDVPSGSNNDENSSSQHEIPGLVDQNRSVGLAATAAGRERNERLANSSSSSPSSPSSSLPMPTTYVKIQEDKENKRVTGAKRHNKQEISNYPNTKEGRRARQSAQDKERARNNNS